LGYTICWGVISKDVCAIATKTYGICVANKSSYCKTFILKRK
jgi:hypothetical protein